MHIILSIGICAAVLAQPTAKDAARMRREEAHQAHQMQRMETQGWLQQIQQAIAQLERESEEAPEPFRRLLKQKLHLLKKQEEAINDKLKAHEKGDSEKARKALMRLEELESEVKGVNLALEEAQALDAVRQRSGMAGLQAEGEQMAGEVQATFERQREIHSAMAQLRQEEAALIRQREVLFEKLDKLIAKKAEK